MSKYIDEYWHPSDDEVIDRSESGIPFKITMDTSSHEGVTVTGTVSTDEDGEFYCFDTYECEHDLDEDDMVALTQWITEDYLS
jgi:hypothetical protein